MSDLSSVWGEDGRVVRMWAIPVRPNGEMLSAQPSTAREASISDLRGIYGFGELITVHLRGTIPEVYERAAQRAKEYREVNV